MSQQDQITFCLLCRPNDFYGFIGCTLHRMSESKCWSFLHAEEAHQDLSLSFSQCARLLLFQGKETAFVALGSSCCRFSFGSFDTRVRRSLLERTKP